LKCWPEYFDAIVLGEKRCEIRKDDRPFGVGDTLRLVEWRPQTAAYTGRQIDVLVTSMFGRKPHEDRFGLKHGYIVMSIRPVVAPPRVTPEVKP
jgi:hypothetical protein